jgi:hypothetical protein
VLVVACLFATLGVAGAALAWRWAKIEDDASARFLAAATYALALGVATARALASVGHLRLLGLLTVFGASAVGARFVGSRDTSSRHPASPRVSSRFLDVPTLLVLAVGALAVGLAVVAARLLPIWAWDALGYHFPFVNYVVQSGTSRAVPEGLTYVSAYPHDAEYLFAILRLGLPNDTWLDAAQIPFGLLGSIVVAATAIRWGAPRSSALAAGVLWLASPAVFLQLPTGYVDVCVAAFFLLAAYWILATPTPTTIVLAGVSLGLLLGSKPSAPLPVALLSSLLVARATRSGRGRGLPAALAGVLVLGAPDYAANVRHFGNPIWPVAVDFGPIHWPGRARVADLLAAGAAAPRLTGPLWWRVVRSWTALRAPAAFDMRFGGFGSAFVLVALPALALAGRTVPSSAWIVLLASVAAPDPATARFVLAFPAVCLALAARASRRISTCHVRIALVLCAALAALDLRYATPALTGEGPSLVRLLAMSDEERLRAVGPDGSPAPWIDLRRSLHAGESIAFDRSFDLPYLLWRRDLSNRVVYLSDATPWDVEATLAREHVRFLIAGTSSTAESVAMKQGARRLFSCRAEPCAVYDLSSAAASSEARP